jgi:hypothetical protein
MVNTKPGAIEFLLLGPVEAARNDRVLPIGGPRQRAPLALCLSGAAGRCPPIAWQMSCGMASRLLTQQPACALMCRGCALAAYHRARALLDEGLGLEPSEDRLRHEWRPPS